MWVWCIDHLGSCSTIRCRRDGLGAIQIHKAGIFIAIGGVKQVRDFPITDLEEIVRWVVILIVKNVTLNVKKRLIFQ
jgi:hypothetical protein